MEILNQLTLKICHVVPFFGEQYGGPERYVNTVVPFQKKEGFDITILTTTRMRKRVGEEVIDGIKVVKLFSYKDIWKINPVSIILPFIMKEEFDIIHVHSHLYFTSNQAIIAGKLKKIPSLLHLHGGIGLPPYQTTTLRRTAKSFYDKTLAKITMFASNLIASVSIADYYTLKEKKVITDGKLIYLPNAVNLAHFNTKNSLKHRIGDGITIIYVGDIEPWKGIDFLEKWIRKNNSSFKKQLKFQFIGQGSNASRIKKLERQTRGKNLNVEFLGEIKHSFVPNFLSKANALILPSYWEAQPTVILEAMAAGVPVLTTPVGDIPYIIRDGENGLLFNLNSKSFENALKILYHDNSNEILQKISRNAHQTIIDDFSIEKVHKKILQTYQNLLQ